MASYTYKCLNTECRFYNLGINHITYNPSEIMYCEHCKKPLQRQFPLNVHITGIDGSKDGKDLGKVTQEKNESLKKKFEGYSYEQQSIRDKVSKMANEKIQKEGNK
jgi:hypothetical protein